ncbi:alpha beta hydrolase [Cryptosporidium felis]|nr:alpha beta hydrolase [Cryptosporidium felis]
MVIQKFVDIAMFPGTYSSYDITSYPETILVPGISNLDRKIPCFLFVPKFNSKIMVIYAHGNGVDIGEIHGRLRYISERLKINVLLFDYPGYGKHEGRSDESSVDQCMNILLNFITRELNWPIENIILWGCSIGTGPSTRLAKSLNEQKKKLGGLILQCPYKSIKHAAESLAGKIGRFLITQRWNIQSEILDCSCPVLWIHGKKDSLFSWTGSLEMYNSYHTHLRSCHFPKDANHHHFDIETDIIRPIQQFINRFVVPSSQQIYDGTYTKIGKKVKFSINRSYNKKLNPYRPTVLDVYLTRNTNVKVSKDCNNPGSEKRFTEKNFITNDNNLDINNVRVIGPKDIKSILPFWGNNKNKDITSIVNQKNTLYLDGDFAPKYLWLNGEAGEYIIKSRRENPHSSNSSSSIFLSSSGEDEFGNSDDEYEDFESETNSDRSDDHSNEELKCFNKLVNSNMINSNQLYRKNIKQRISYNNINTNVYSIYCDNIEQNKKFGLKKRNVILNNPSIFRMECRSRVESSKNKSFERNEELLLNFWPITNLYCYLYDQYYTFFRLILEKLLQGNISFLKNGNDTFLSIIMWVRRLYYLYTPTLFMNSVYAYSSDSDQWVLDGVTIGNIYIQLSNINGINGRIAVRKLDKAPISKCFPPPFFIVAPIYIPPKPFFQPIAEWIVRTIYRLHVYNIFKSKKSGKYCELGITQKYINVNSFNDPMSQLETKCLLEELSFSSLQHFLLSNARPKIEKLALITGFGNWIPFGWYEFFVKLFESNSKHYLQRLLFLNSDNTYTNNSDFVKLLVPFYLPSFVDLGILFKIIKSKIKIRNEWIDSRIAASSGDEQEKNINNLIRPEICNNIFNNLMIVINTSTNITNGFIFNNVLSSKEKNAKCTGNQYLLKNNQFNWEEILKDFDSFSNFISCINFYFPKLFLPGISQAFRGKHRYEHSFRKDSTTSCNSANINISQLGAQVRDIQMNDHLRLINLDVESGKIDSYRDETESPEQPVLRSIQGKIVMIEEGLNKDDEKNDLELNKEPQGSNSNSNELPLTWESVFFNSKDPLSIINQMQHQDRVYMGMSPPSYIVLHKLLYEKYSFLRLNYESEYVFRLLWHFSHCCIYHGNLLNNSLGVNPNSFTIHPLQCSLLITGILRRALEDPNNSDLIQLNWIGDINDEQYLGFNSSCLKSDSNRKINILERILAISIELLENGVCNQIVNYKMNSTMNDSFILGNGIRNILSDSRQESTNGNFEDISKMKTLFPNQSDSLVSISSIENNADIDERKETEKLPEQSMSSSLSSSRISSFESIVQKVYDNKKGRSETTNFFVKQPHKVVVYPSTTKLLERNNCFGENTKTLKRIAFNEKYKKGTRVVNLNDQFCQVMRFSPIISNELKSPSETNLGVINQAEYLNISGEKNNLESCKSFKPHNKLKVFASSPLKIFRKQDHYSK